VARRSNRKSVLPKTPSNKSQKRGKKVNDGAQLRGGEEGIRLPRLRKSLAPSASRSIGQTACATGKEEKTTRLGTRAEEGVSNKEGMKRDL